MVLDAFERTRCIVADLAVLTDYLDYHDAKANARQTMTLVRATLDRLTPVIEVRPLRTWPANRRLVAERSIALSQEPGFAVGQVPTVLTGDQAFDATFVVRAVDKRATKDFLTAEVRRAMLACPNATMAFAHATLVVIEPGLQSEGELNQMLHLVESVRAKLALPAYAA